MRSESNANANLSNRLPVQFVLSTLGVCLFAVLVLRRGWVSEDAYFTLRTIDNFLNGHGLVWNVGERVQVFTHPLWMALLALCISITRESFVTPIILGTALSASSLWLCMRWCGNSLTAILFVAGAFIFSSTLVDYGTSGLENALLQVLVIVFVFLFLSKRSLDSRQFLLGLCTSALLLTRADSIFWLVPPLFIEARSLMEDSSKRLIRTRVMRFMVGLAPFVGWCVFALFYYGDFLPNSARAKLPLGLPRHGLIMHGLGALLSNIERDTWTTFIIACGGILGSRMGAGVRAIACGIALHILYFVWVGGDFMLGRFLTVPYLLAVLIISEAVKTGYFGTANNRMLVILGCALGLSIGNRPWSLPTPLQSPRDTIDMRGVADERLFFLGHADLVHFNKDQPMPDFVWANQGRRDRSTHVKFYAHPNVGMYGYFVGPNCHVLDLSGLGDPLLARLPMLSNSKWRVGHYMRRVPQGYVESLKTGVNRIREPGVRKYYDQVRSVTRGPLWSIERLWTTLLLKIGHYDRVIEDYQ